MVLLLIDDALMVHENVAAWGHSTFGIPRMIAELGFVSGLALIVFSLLFISRAKAKGVAKTQATVLILLMVLLGIFGVGVDAIHAVLNSIFASYLLHSVLAVVENGGELIATSLIAAQSLLIRQLK